MVITYVFEHWYFIKTYYLNYSAIKVENQQKFNTNYCIKKKSVAILKIEIRINASKTNQLSTFVLWKKFSSTFMQKLHRIRKR